MEFWKANAVITDAYVLTGDSGNFGGGNLIGLFIDENKAKEAAIGRGSMDCGGNGRVTKRKVVVLDGKYYLLDEKAQFPVKPDTVRPRKKYTFEDIIDE